MGLFYFVILISAFSSVFCQYSDCEYYCKKQSNTGLELKEYGAYLIGFTMLIMFLIIIGLSVALYMLKNNKSMFGITLNKTPVYVRQESTQGVVGGNYTPHNTINDMSQNNGSTLTVNSGIVELGGLGEPETPTPTLKEPREEIKPPVIIKPKRPTMPYIQREQMDHVIQEVLASKRQKSESTIMNELEMIANADAGECLYVNAQELHERNKLMTEPKNEVRKTPTLTIKKSPTLQSNHSPTLRGQSVVDGRGHFETKVSVDDEHEVYDTLPNPVRCKGTDADDADIDNIPVYDLPPTRHRNMGEINNVVLDTETDYMLLLSKNSPEDQEKACYINAKSH